MHQQSENNPVQLIQHPVQQQATIEQQLVNTDNLGLYNQCSNRRAYAYVQQNEFTPQFANEISILGNNQLQEQNQQMSTASIESGAINHQFATSNVAVATISMNEIQSIQEPNTRAGISLHNIVKEVSQNSKSCPVRAGGNTDDGDASVMLQVHEVQVHVSDVGDIEPNETAVTSVSNIQVGTGTSDKEDTIRMLQEYSKGKELQQSQMEAISTQETVGVQDGVSSNNTSIVLMDIDRQQGIDTSDPVQDDLESSLRSNNDIVQPS